MISKKIQKALEGSSAIRARLVEGNELAAKVGSGVESKDLHNKVNFVFCVFK